MERKQRDSGSSSLNKKLPGTFDSVKRAPSKSLQIIKHLGVKLKSVYDKKQTKSYPSESGLAIYAPGTSPKNPQYTATSLSYTTSLSTSDKDPSSSTPLVETGQRSSSKAVTIHEEFHSSQDSLLEAGRPSSSLPDTISHNETYSGHEPTPTRPTGLFRLIAEENVLSLALSHYPVSNVDSAKVISSFCGANNLFFVIQYCNGIKVCLKVPFGGIRAGEWTSQDAFNLRHAAQSMRFVHFNTTLPVPYIIACDPTRANRINAPYILMSFVEGKPLDIIWWSRHATVSQDDRRQAILKNLASLMYELRILEFSSPGCLHFKDDRGAPELYPFKIQTNFRRTARDTSQEDYWHSKGCLMISKMMLNCLPQPADKSTLPAYLAAPNTNLDNILADEYGNITSFLKWEYLSVLPAYLSWASLPAFLRKDWVLTSQAPENEVSSRSIARYRKDYAWYLTQASEGEEEEVFWTEKTHMLHAIYDHSETVQYKDVVYKVLGEMVLDTKEEIKENLTRIGREGWMEGEKEAIEESLEKLLGPAKGVKVVKK
ncbi:MAG: hypothetical protein M1820_006620 [Bogoriella megaspora]|nr:MAG: hypothetical protein M1820_006620 [Bogoriella megaspora]